MENEIKASKLEKVLINMGSPIIYCMSLGLIPFKEITENHERDYKRFVKYFKNNEKIPSRIRILYHLSFCGNLIVGTAYMRKYFI